MRTLLAALLIASGVGCATQQTTHSKLADMCANHAGVNFDNWPSTDQAEFDRLLQLEIAGK